MNAIYLDTLESLLNALIGMSRNIPEVMTTLQMSVMIALKKKRVIIVLTVEVNISLETGAAMVHRSDIAPMMISIVVNMIMIAVVVGMGTVMTMSRVAHIGDIVVVNLCVAIFSDIADICVAEAGVDVFADIGSFRRR